MDPEEKNVEEDIARVRGGSDTKKATTAKLKRRLSESSSSSSTSDEDERDKKKKKGGLFQTGDLTRQTTGAQEEFLLVSIRDFLLYAVFVTLITFIAVDMVTDKHYYFANVGTTLVVDSKFNTSTGLQKTFREIRILDQIWDFFNHLMLILDAPTNTDLEALDDIKLPKALVFAENLIISPPRIRQVRVRNDSCTVPEGFKYIFDNNCYYFFNPKTEDRGPFGLGSGTLWTYQEAEKTKEDSFVGEISTYTAGGFYMDFSFTNKETNDTIMEMFSNTWIDHGTRAILVDFATYARAENLFCIYKLVMEIPPSGGVITTADIRVQKLLRYNTWYDHLILGFEAAFMCLVVYYTLEEIWEMIIVRKKYFKNPWNYFDNVILLLSYATFIVGFFRHEQSKAELKSMMEGLHAQKHMSFDRLKYIQTVYEAMVGFVALGVWLKVFKYTYVVRPGALILNAFQKVKIELLALTLMLLLLVFGFAMFAHVIFGTHVEEFNTISNSMFTLIALFAGGLYFYRECEEARPLLAPAFFILYIFVVILLFLNWFAAVTVHGLSRASKDLEALDDVEETVFLSDLFRNIIKRILLCLRCRGLYAKMHLADVNRKKRTDLEVILSLLRRNGFSPFERRLFLARHDIPPGTTSVTQTKMDDVIEDINGMNKLYTEVDDHEVIMEQVDRMKKKLEVLDHALSDIVVKVDVLMDKMRYQEIEDKKKKK